MINITLIEDITNSNHKIYPLSFSLFFDASAILGYNHIYAFLFNINEESHFLLIIISSEFHNDFV